MDWICKRFIEPNLSLAESGNYGFSCRNTVNQTVSRTSITWKLQKSTPLLKQKSVNYWVIERVFMLLTDFYSNFKCVWRFWMFFRFGCFSIFENFLFLSSKNGSRLSRNQYFCQFGMFGKKFIVLFIDDCMCQISQRNTALLRKIVSLISVEIWRYRCNCGAPKHSLQSRNI